MWINVVTIGKPQLPIFGCTRNASIMKKRIAHIKLNLTVHLAVLGTHVRESHDDEEVLCELCPYKKR